MVVDNIGISPPHHLSDRATLWNLISTVQKYHYRLLSSWRISYHLILCTNINRSSSSSFASLSVLLFAKLKRFTIHPPPKKFSTFREPWKFHGVFLQIALITANVIKLIDILLSKFVRGKLWKISLYLFKSLSEVFFAKRFL